MPTSARPAPCRRAFHTPPLYICFLVMPPAALSCRRKRGNQVGAGIPISPPRHTPETANRGLRPLLDVPPGKEGMPARPERRGRYNVSPRRPGAASRTARGKLQGGIAIAPSWSFQGMGVGKGEIEIPLPNRLFRPFLAAQKGARRRLDKKAGVKKGSHGRRASPA